MSLTASKPPYRFVSFSTSITWSARVVMDQRIISISLQFGQFVGHGAGGGADLRLSVIRGDEEAQGGGAGGARGGRPGGRGGGGGERPTWERAGGGVYLGHAGTGGEPAVSPPQLASDLESV